MADGRDEKVWTFHAGEHKNIWKAHDVPEDAVLRVMLKQANPKGPCLDYGCGSGLWKNLFKDFDYYGVDQNEAMIKVAKERWPDQADRFIQVNWFGSHIDSGSVDLIFTSAVIQHNKHQDKDYMLKEFNRMLKPGGHYLMTECTFRPDNYRVAFPGVPNFHDNLDDGYSFTKNGWEQFMGSYGFKLVRYEHPSEYLWQKV